MREGVHARTRGKGVSFASGRLAVALLTVLAALMVAAPSAHADGERRQVVICDGTGCLVAYLVVDSDGDGVCDADELMAGTDPFDPTSVPPLLHLVELL